MTQYNSIDEVQIAFDADELWLLNLILAGIMFGVALEIKIEDFKILKQNPRAVLTGVFSQFILLPFGTFLLVSIWEPIPSIALGMFMVAACPGGNISNFMTHYSKGNVALSVCLTACATLLAIFMTPLNFQIWAGNYGPTQELLQQIRISPKDMFKAIVLLLGAPLVLGMLCNHFFENWSAKAAVYFKKISVLIFLCLVGIALVKNWEHFIGYILVVFWIVVAHNLLAFGLGFGLANTMRLSSSNIKTITIETGIQNSGLGLLLIFSFFKGLGGMALLAAFWGIWHIVSGLILASLWNKK
ncbi:MAG: bile acid:sodium symporter family protein [Flavobacteriaceae bacterium]|nr:bile acid:sodium symporter family protein [Flavobacteriaceae bacterium]